VPLAVLIAVFLVFWYYRRNWGRPLLFAMGYYVVMLLPILGFFNIYFMRYSLVADHYQYVSIIGIISLITAAAHQIIARAGTLGKNLARTAAILIIAMLGTLTLRQVSAYKNEETLWRDTLRKNPLSWMTHYHLGHILKRQNKFDEAINHYNTVIRLRPNHAQAHNSLGMIYQSQGKLNEAIDYYRKAVQLDPNCFEAYNNLGYALQLQNKFSEAVDCYHRALEIKPDLAQVHCNLGSVFHSQGKLDDAINHYSQALQIAPDLAPVYYNMANVLLLQGKTGEAVNYYQQAIQRDPNFVEAYDSLGNIFQAYGRLNEAITYYRQALRVRPDYIPSLNAAVSILATHTDPGIRDVNQAIIFAEQAAGLTAYDDPVILDTLATAYAAAGLFDKAITAAQKALKLADAAKSKKLADQIRSRLASYQQKRP
jgi:tetratricopeptide (TPR) repeat protein